MRTDYHHTFSWDGARKVINIQPKSSKAKVCPVKQIRSIILKQKLGDKTLIRYEMIIYLSQEDSAFIAEVPELPGCMADGSTIQGGRRKRRS